MNVRNFSDLDDILIDASENDDYYQNSGYEYDEDVFEQEESPTKDQAKGLGQLKSSFDDIDSGGDNNDQDYTRDQEEQQAAFIEFEDDVDLKDITDPDEDQDGVTNNNGPLKLLDVEEKKNAVLIDIDVPSVDDRRNYSELQGERKVVTQNSFVNQSSESNVVKPTVITSRSEYMGNKSQFSHVRKVSGDDGAFILNQQKKNIDNRVSVNGTNGSKEEKIHSLQEMIEIAAERISTKNKAISSVASRAIPVPAIQLGISNGQNRDLFGIPYYNPDYDSALEMMKKIIHNTSPIHEGYDSNHARSSSYRSNEKMDMTDKPIIRRNSNDNQYFSNNQNLNRNSDSKNLSKNRESYGLTALPLGSSFAPERQTLSRDAYNEKGIVTSLLEEINNEKENLQLLRLGVDRNMLCDKSEEIHSSFLSDLIELCRARSAGSTSIEELAMHRALTEHVREKFLLPGVIKSTRASMVSTAVEVSLKYVPIKRNSTPEFIDYEGRKSDNIGNMNSSIESKKKSLIKQRKKVPKGTVKKTV